MKRGKEITLKEVYERLVRLEAKVHAEHGVIKDTVSNENTLIMREVRNHVNVIKFLLFFTAIASIIIIVAK